MRYLSILLVSNIFKTLQNIDYFCIKKQKVDKIQYVSRCDLLKSIDACRLAAD